MAVVMLFVPGELRQALAAFGDVHRGRLERHLALTTILFAATTTNALWIPTMIEHISSVVDEETEVALQRFLLMRSSPDPAVEFAARILNRIGEPVRLPVLYGLAERCPGVAVDVVVEALVLAHLAGGLDGEVIELIARVWQVQGGRMASAASAVLAFNHQKAVERVDCRR